MNAILIGNNPDRTAAVYPLQTMDTLGVPHRVFRQQDLNTTDFQKTQYLFATWGMPVLTRAEIQAFFPSLKAVFYAAGSVQQFAEPYLELGIAVFSAWSSNARPVAEFTVAQIVLANTGYFQSVARGRNAAQGYDGAAAFAGTFGGNYKAVVGLLGAGAIGKLVIQLLKSLEVEVWVYDPFLPPETAQALGVRLCGLEEIFAGCHVISNHLANHESIRGIVNARLLGLMQPGATFINTGRGAQVVEADLVAHLEKNPDFTALLDVTEPEPPPPGSAFYILPNVFLSPHIAGAKGREVWRMSALMAEEYQRFAAGKPTRHGVTREMLKTMA